MLRSPNKDTVYFDSYNSRFYLPVQKADWRIIILIEKYIKMKTTNTNLNQKSISMIFHEIIQIITQPKIYYRNAK